MRNSNQTLKLTALVICSGVSILSDAACAFPFIRDSLDPKPADRMFNEVKFRPKNNNFYKDNSLKHQNLYNQNAGVDPMGWLLSGPALDTAATAMARPYYESYGYHSVPRNYIYYDWGW